MPLGPQNGAKSRTFVLRFTLAIINRDGPCIRSAGKQEPAREGRRQPANQAEVYHYVSTDLCFVPNPPFAKTISKALFQIHVRVSSCSSASLSI